MSSEEIPSSTKGKNKIQNNKLLVASRQPAFPQPGSMEAAEGLFRGKEPGKIDRSGGEVMSTRQDLERYL